MITLEKHVSKRSWRGLFIRPSRQLKLTLAILSIGILTMAGLMGYLVLRVAAVITTLQVLHPDVAIFVQRSMSPVLDVLIAFQLLFWITSMFLGVVISHRFYGPVVPLVRHIRKLAEGDYTSRTQLRKGDELEEIATALNDLAEKLEKKT